MLSLPVELYRPIAQHVERRRDLASFSLASRSVQSEVEPELYRSFGLWGRFYKGVVWPQSTLVPILKQLANNPRQASHIHTLHVNSTSSIHRLVIPVLSATINLKRLVLHIPLGIPLDPSNLPLFKLDWLLIMVQHTMLMSDEIDFLERQTELKEMEWHHLRDVQYDLPFSIANLTTLLLHGRMSARTILLQQTVTNLSQEDGFSGYQSGDIFTSVRSLKTSKPLEVRQAKQFPNLQYLSTTVRT